MLKKKISVQLRIVWDFSTKSAKNKIILTNKLKVSKKNLTEEANDFLLKEF